MPEPLLRVETPLGKIVVCTHETWINHIEFGHPVMKGNSENVKETLKNPIVVYGSDQKENRDIYFAKSTYNNIGNEFYTKVVVENREIDSIVVSAWPQKDVAGGIDEEAIKYVNPKLR